jgi:quinol monooxygenase YgiN
MTAFNVVRMRVKPGREDEFIAAHRAIREKFRGNRKFSVIKTGDRTFCIIGEWSGMASIANARPKMLGILDTFREMLEDQGNGLGVTDPISGEAVFQRSFASAPAGAKRGATKKKKPAARKPAKPAGKTAKRRAR